MSFEKLRDERGADVAIPIWMQYRSEFPVTERFVYLNHAAVAPLSRRCAEAMSGLAQDALNYGSYHYDAWVTAYDEIRRSAARLIGATPDEIAIVKNTSEGVATVALGLDWVAGDRVICFREEFPANYLPWKQLESRGVRVETLSITDPLEKVDEACRGARLLAMSFVNYVSGIRVDLQAFGEICRRRGCFFFVDAIQGLGAFPIDVESAHIDALAADGHKWLLGPEGCGLLYVRAERQPEIEPAEFGWTNVANFGTHSLEPPGLRQDAGRYECGTLNTIGCYGLRAALNLILEAGMDRIAAQVQALGDRIANGVSERGYELLAPRTPTSGAGIVSFRKAGVDGYGMVRKLKDAGIQAAPRHGWIRTSPHFYINDDDIDQMLAELE